MKSGNRRRLLAIACSTVAMSWTQQAYAQTPAIEPARGVSDATQGPNARIADIIVTAQKRSERLQDVPMSITAATGNQLTTRGVTNPEQLEKVVPGFTINKTLYGPAVYFIRGIGFNDTTLGVSPAVSVYMDQLPIPFSPMARGATLDLERVEVLKGPQGTFFGQNSTGGAINFIAAKPTDELKAGFDLTYGRFNEVDAEVFVSGPLSKTLSARLAVRNEYRGDWQKGYTTDESLGKKDFHNGRLLVDWNPAERIKVELSATGWQDTSDSQQPQFVRFDPLQPDPVLQAPILYPIATFPTAPNNSRAAAWDPGRDFSQDNWFYQFGGRIDVELTDAINLTSLTSYAKYGHHLVTEFDATSYPLSLNDQNGDIRSFSQELRLSGSAAGDRIKWMIGGNYQNDRVFERLISDPNTVSTNQIAPGFIIKSFYVDNLQKIETKAVFGSLDLKFSDTLTAQGSVRYTTQDRDFAGCLHDSGDGSLAGAFSLFPNPPHTFQPGDCVTLTAAFAAEPNVTDSVTENNLSWRASLNWKPDQNTLLYANITKGYKGGSFGTIPYILATQAQLIKQESVLAYEIGGKLSLLDRKLQLDGAVFYYDYTDKQLNGFRNIPPFLAVPGLVTIPKATVKGAEISAMLRPIERLTISANATYVHSRIDKNPANPIDFLGRQNANFVGRPFSSTPKWQGVADAEYRFPVSGSLDAYVGSSMTWHSATTGLLASGDPVADALVKMPSYVLLDVRAGLETQDKSWRLEAWGRNVTNKFYLVGNLRNADYYTRFTGMPVTYGISLFYRY